MALSTRCADLIKILIDPKDLVARMELARQATAFVSMILATRTTISLPNEGSSGVRYIDINDTTDMSLHIRRIKLTMSLTASIQQLPIHAKEDLLVICQQLIQLAVVDDGIAACSALEIGAASILISLYALQEIQSVGWVLEHVPLSYLAKCSLQWRFITMKITYLARKVAGRKVVSNFYEFTKACVVCYCFLITLVFIYKSYISVY